MRTYSGWFSNRRIKGASTTVLNKTKRSPLHVGILGDQPDVVKYFHRQPENTSLPTILRFAMQRSDGDAKDAADGVSINNDQLDASFLAYHFTLDEELVKLFLEKGLG